MSSYLEHLARRLEADPYFLAAALAVYARSERLDDAGLAERLGCPVPALTHLRLCRSPRPEAPFFWRDVEVIAGRFAVNPDALADAVRRGQALLHLRGPAGAVPGPGPGFLLAARDGPPDSEPPEEKP